MTKDLPSLSVVIPTYRRGEILVDTLKLLLKQQLAADEILVVDQKPGHPVSVQKKLAELERSKKIRRIRLNQPCITAAMNRGLLEASGEIVLFMDDDVVPSAGLVKFHLANYQDESTWAVVGQVLQPGQLPDLEPPGDYIGPGLWTDLDFRFNGTKPRQLYNCMAGNLSVRREKALAVGGMDTQFKGVAYRFETEFARRLTDRGGKVMFEPRAVLHHLRAPSGGTRPFGNHLTSSNPAHGVGDYYMALRLGHGVERWQYIGLRMLRSVSTRFHFKHPWWIPVKLIGELRALLWAIQLNREGPKLMTENRTLR